jgi:hypothetical protein
MARANALTVRLAIHMSNHGFPRGSGMQLNDPVHKEGVPTVGGDFSAMNKEECR